MTPANLRIANATVVLPDGPKPVDVIVRDGVIVDLVAADADIPAADVLDCAGLHVFPGVVDAHVHLGPNITYPQGPDDVVGETRSAAAGGITTLLAYLMSPDRYEDAFEVAKTAMEADSSVDFGFHFCVVSREQLEVLPAYVSDLGVSSFKFFMSFKGDEGAYLGLPGNDDGFLFDLLEACADTGAMLDPHAENIELIWRLRAMGHVEGATDLHSWDMARPDYVEAEALHRLGFLAKITGASVYAVHTSNAMAVDVLREARQSYEHIFMETCPHYLTLDVDSGCGTYGKVNPPLRAAADREALWAALALGEVDTIGSDHVPRHRSFKEKDIWTASAGFPGMQNLLPLLLSEGLSKRSMSPQQIAEVTSTRPAKLFGLYPKKGVIQVGSDADIAIVDLETTQQISAATQFSGAEYTPWEGWEVTSQVRHTLLRGEFIHSDTRPTASPSGRFVPRHASGAAALKAVS